MKIDQIYSERVALNAMFVVALLYALVRTNSKVAFAVICLFYILAFFYVAIYQRALFKTAPFYFLIGSVLLALFVWIMTKLQVPHIATKSPKLSHFTDLFLFLSLAVALQGDKRKTFIFWGVAGVSALLTAWLAGDGFVEIERALDGHRSGFGRHIIGMGIIYATMFVALLVFFRRAVFESKQIYRWVLWVSLLVITSFGFWASQTRAIYIGLVLVWLVALSIAIYFSIKSYKEGRFFISYFLIVTAVLSAVFLTLLEFGVFSLVENRLASEQSVWKYLLAGEWDKIPKNSLGYRFHFWIDSVRWIWERPIIGWGQDGGVSMHKEAGNIFGKRNFITVHNDLLEILIGYGVLGLALVISAMTWLSRGVYGAWKRGVIASDLMLFFVLFMVFMLFNGVALSTLFFKDTKFLWSIVLAGYAGFVIKDRYLSKKDLSL